jgi:hypothetical protein
VHIELSRIHRGKEILSKKWKQTHRDHGKAEDQGNELPGVSESETQQITIAFSESFESIIEPSVKTGEPGKKRKRLPPFGLV